jgi:hypothetical protein
MVQKADLEAELKEAIRSGDKTRRDTLRMVLTAIKLEAVEKREDLDEKAILNVIRNEVKTRLEALTDAKKAGRKAMIASLENEKALLESYLPQPLSEEELNALVQKAIKETDAVSPQDLGKVMKWVMSRAQGRADGKKTSQIVRDQLSE